MSPNGFPCSFGLHLVHSLTVLSLILWSTALVTMLLSAPCATPVRSTMLRQMCARAAHLPARAAAAAASPGVAHARRQSFVAPTAFTSRVAGNGSRLSGAAAASCPAAARRHHPRVRPWGSGPAAARGNGGRSAGQKSAGPMFPIPNAAVDAVASDSADDESAPPAPDAASSDGAGADAPRQMTPEEVLASVPSICPGCGVGLQCNDKNMPAGPHTSSLNRRQSHRSCGLPWCVPRPFSSVPCPPLTAS
jgi:hypothetical protein